MTVEPISKEDRARIIEMATKTSRPNLLPLLNTNDKAYMEAAALAFPAIEAALQAAEAKIAELECDIKITQHGWDISIASTESWRKQAETAAAHAVRFQEALTGPYPEEPQIGHLSWLRSLLDDARARGPAPETDDPDAWWQMIGEVEEFHRRARAALSSQTNRGDADNG